MLKKFNGRLHWNKALMGYCDTDGTYRIIPQRTLTPLGPVSGYMIKINNQEHNKIYKTLSEAKNACEKLFNKKS